jgi:diguanylate cyclase (GGDEF)-like protein/PAS domain S-box-containing protein
VTPSKQVGTEIALSLNMHTHKKPIAEKQSGEERPKKVKESYKVESSEVIRNELFAIMDGVEAGIYVADMQTYKILYVNEYIERHFGKNLIGKKCYKVLHAGQDKPCPFCTNDLLLVEKPGLPVVWDFQNTKTGLWYHCIDKAIRWPDGRFVRMEIAIDITERKKSEFTLRNSERFLNTIFESINDPFNILDCDYRIIKANEPYARMRGKTVEQLIEKRCYEVLQKRDDVCEGCSVKETFDTGKPHTKEKLVSFPGGSQAWIEIYTYPIFDENGKVVKVIEYTRDVTKRKRTEAERDILVDKLQYLYRTDDLTGLLNRRALIEELEDEVRRTKRYKSDLSLIICDIDYFKEINDNFGHDTGDRVLQNVSALIKESLRNTDLIGRYGGDEFLLILPETSMEGAKEIADRIRLAVKEFELQMEGNKPIRTTVSLGVAEFNADKEDINGLIKRADNALYMAKGRGRNRVYIIGN